MAFKDAYKNICENYGILEDYEKLSSEERHVIIDDIEELTNIVSDAWNNFTDKDLRELHAWFLKFNT